MFLRQVIYSFSSVVRQILNFILIPCLKTEWTHTRMCNHQGSSTISSDLIEHTHCRYTADGKVCSLISLQENLWSFSCAHIFPPDVQIPSHIKQLCKSSVLESLNSLKCKYKSISQTSAQCFKINSSPDDWIWKKKRDSVNYPPMFICSRLSFRFRPCITPHSLAQLLPPQGASTQGHRKYVFNDHTATRAPGQLLRVPTFRQYDAPSHAP